MNKILNLSAIPLAATATLASVALASAPVQAATIQLAGTSTFVDGTPDILDLEGVFAFGGTGVLAGLDGSLTIEDISFGSDVTADGTYSASVPSNPFMTFADGTTFTIDNPFDVVVRNFPLGDGLRAAFNIEEFTGVFSDGRTGIGEFSAQRRSDGSYSATIEVEAIPEPLTILGTGLALGFGGLFKSKNSKKQSAEV